MLGLGALTHQAWAQSLVRGTKVSQAMKVKESESEVAELCPTLCDPMDYIVMEFSRPEYWSGYLIPSPVDLPNSGIEQVSPALQVILYQLSYQESP